ncbi:MAG: phenylalanine--tRNA ligase subunit beta [Spirosomataceae bacterium]
MKISLNWLKEYIDIDVSPEELGKLLTSTGLEVESIEPIEAVKGGLNGVVLGEVLTCEPFMVKEKQLSLCTVHIGTDEPSTIVCGAANVRAGQRVVVATVGATLYPAGAEEGFTIAKRKVYGHPSEGMICAEDELGLGTDHSGILVLDTDLPNGTPATTYFNLEPDYLIEIGLTPNRADAASHIGVVRDLAAVLHKSICWPDVSGFQVNSNEYPVELIVEDAEGCPRFCGVTIDGVAIQESPEWLKKRLLTIGLRPINNVVDITNFICHELGQPMHAYDWHALADQKIVVKNAREGQKFTTLDGVERTLSAHDLMICDGQKPVGIAGVFGGFHSGIKESTTRVYLEVAYFDPGKIRKTAQRHGLKTDASFRFERGTDPNAKLYTLQRATLLIQELAGGVIASEVTDFYPNPIPKAQVNVTRRNINRLIGKELPKELIKEILQSLDIEVADETADGFTAIVATYRVDVLREADIVEEILRIYGFDNVELSSSLSSDFLASFPKKDKDKTQFRLTQLLAGSGFQEIFSNSLTRPAYAEAIKDELLGENVEILNKLSEDLGVLRQSMLFSGLEALAYNINRRQRDLKFFEFGKTYHLINGKYVEKSHLALFITGNTANETWQQKSRAVTFHDLASVVQRVLAKMNIRDVETKETENSTLAYGISYVVNKKEVVSIGLVKPTLAKLCDIKQPVFYADVDWDYLLRQHQADVVYQELSKYPEVRRDLSLLVDKSVSFKQIRDISQKHERNLLKAINVFDVYEGDNIGADKKSYSVSFILQDFTQTLTDAVIDKTMQRLMNGFERELGAVIRK